MQPHEPVLVLSALMLRMDWVRREKAPQRLHAGLIGRRRPHWTSLPLADRDQVFKQPLLTFRPRSLKQGKIDYRLVSFAQP